MNYEKFLKQDKKGKYFLIDSDRFVLEDFNGITRMQLFNKLVEIGFIKPKNFHKGGIENFITLINRILDGSFYIGRFKIYRVSDMTDTLEQQMEREQKRYMKEGL